MGGMMSEKVKGLSKHTVNRWVAAMMPLVMMGLVGYATWVFVVLICINHLLLYQHRKPSAIVLITLYFILFLLLAAAYLRVLTTIFTDPGFVPEGFGTLQGIANEKIEDVNDSNPEIGLGSVRGQRWLDNSENEETARPGTATTASRGNATVDSIPQSQNLDLAFPSTTALFPPARSVSATPTSNAHLPPPIHQDRPLSSNAVQGRSYGSYRSGHPVEMPEPANLGEFYKRDVFVCETDGRPRWCHYCNGYKPDRSHHCSEVRRCVYKMDHFCPWVGGIVAETSYKFFYQVVVYGSFYCLFLIISVAVIVHEQIISGGAIEPSWLAALGLSCLFGLFSTGMAGSTTQLIYRNLSTVDSLNYTDKVYQLAIYDPAPPEQPAPGQGQVYSQLVPRVWLPTNPVQGQGQRCFAIAKTEPGDNPWRLRNTMDNFKEVLGYSLWDWWLPIKQSPLVKKDSAEGLYRWNEELLQRLREEAGIGIGRTA